MSGPASQALRDHLYERADVPDRLADVHESVGPTVVLMPPRGHYLAHEVGQLAGVSGSQIGQWAHYGYIRASQSAAHEYPRIYSYQDVAEAIIVHELIDDLVPLPVLRPVIEALRERFGDWPLQRAQLETLTAPDIAIAALLVREGQERYELGPHGWQQVEGATINPQRVVADLRRGGWAARQLHDLHHIVVDPDFLSGRPAIKGRRVPVSLVAELAITPDGEEVLQDDYGLSPAEVSDAVRWWQTTAKYERVVA
jgi:uncharacterized protein (DUF433 family)/DNA-binding transcriptional MerR regulator